MDPWSSGGLLTHHSGGWHGDEEGLRWWFPSPAGCREELLDPPELRSTTMPYSMFCRKMFGPLGFSRWREFIGGRAMSEEGQGAHTTWWRGQGVARATLVRPPPSCSPSLLWTQSSCEVNRNFGFRFVQFPEYFLRNFSETQTVENRNWHRGILLIG
jgi:hypothetical protein